MSSVPARPPEHTRCAVMTSLMDVEAAKLRVVCGQVPAPQAVLSCEVGAGHDGHHMAFAASTDGGDLWWWLCWAGQTRELRQIETCEGSRLDDPYLDDCLLPDGHPGPHSFDLRNG